MSSHFATLLSHCDRKAKWSRCPCGLYPRLMHFDGTSRRNKATNKPLQACCCIAGKSGPYRECLAEALDLPRTWNQTYCIWGELNEDDTKYPYHVPINHKDPVFTFSVSITSE